MEQVHWRSIHHDNTYAIKESQKEGCCCTAYISYDHIEKVLHNKKNSLFRWEDHNQTKWNRLSVQQLYQKQRFWQSVGLKSGRPLLTSYAGVSNWKRSINLDDLFPLWLNYWAGTSTYCFSKFVMGFTLFIFTLLVSAHNEYLQNYK